MTSPPPPPTHDPLAGLDGDESIPLLTEVVQLLPQAPAGLPESLADVDWATLAQQVQDNVIERLMQHTESLLDTQVRDLLGPLLERATRQLSADLEVALSEFTRELVARAVSEELTRVHAEIAHRGAQAPERP